MSSFYTLKAINFNMRNFLKDESAVSYGFFIMGIFLIGFSAIWAMFAPALNMIFSNYNGQISQGMVTVQNQQAMQFHYNVIYVGPLIMLLGLGTWCLVYSLGKRNEV